MDWGLGLEIAIEMLSLTLATNHYKTGIERSPLSGRYPSSPPQAFFGFRWAFFVA